MKNAKIQATKKVVKHDFLAQAAERVNLSKEKLRAVRRWLTEQLVAHEYAKLSEGGHKQSQVPLRQVFVDLPVTTNPSANHGREERPLFLRRLLSSTPLDLRRSFKHLSEPSLSKHASTEEEDEAEERGIHAVIGADGEIHYCWPASLLIGGPGQGKSTVGQLACQLHRVALIRPASNELNQAQIDLINSFDENPLGAESEAASTSLAIPSKPLFPIQIALPDFAAWAAASSIDGRKTELPVLLEFVASLPSASSAGIDGRELLSLLGTMPCLLVLDGFDEVGATQDRARIVAAARELLLTLAELDAQAQVLATTRPQGYADELSKVGIKFQKLYLSPLTRDEALNYADKLIAAKISGADLRAKARQQIHEAAKEPATERLLTTPLQVTIMAALVQQLGRAPRERWNLFNRYFSTTYDREIERNTYASALLAEHRSHIERIHARVALLLQVEAERHGGAAARMPRERLEEVIEEVLAEDEVATDRRKYLIIEIAKAAENRLVFLVEPEPGKFGFEIRSLQEFMAAWALTSGRDAEVEARLHQVAKAPMFKNVALFVASRLFSEGSPLRDVLADRICASLDDDPTDSMARLAHSGAMLALDTLDEGAALAQPKRSRALMARAVSLFSLPPGLEHLRLIRLADEETLPTVQSALELALSSVEEDKRFCKESAWICVIDAANRSEPWACQMGDRFWGQGSLTPTLVDAIERNQVGLGTWFCKKIELLGEGVDLSELIQSSALTRERRTVDSETWLGWLVSVFGATMSWRHRTRSGILPILNSKLKTAIPAPPSYPTPKGKQWATWAAVGIFQSCPTAKTLSAALEAIANTDDLESWGYFEWWASWPLVCCLGIATSAIDLLRISRVVAAGKLGDSDDWARAELTWKGERHSSLNLGGLTDGMPWNPESLGSSPPFLAIPLWRLFESRRARVKQAEALKTLEQAAVIFQESKGKLLRIRIAYVCLMSWRMLSKNSGVNRFDPKPWIEVARSAVALLVPRPRFLSVEDWKLLLDRAPLANAHPWFLGAPEIISALAEAPNHPAILRLAVRFFATHAEHLGQSEIDTPQMLSILRQPGEWKSIDANLQADVGTLLIFAGENDSNVDRDTLVAVAEEAKARPEAWENFLSVLQSSSIQQRRLESLLSNAYDVLGNAHLQSSRVLRQIRDQLQTRVSDLDNQTTWDSLSLPLPYPKPPLQARLVGGIPVSPVRIQKIELRDIGGIRKLSIPLNQPASELGQWTVILGPNGSGKTTILRSMVLALRNVKNPSIWPKGSFGIAWQRIQNVAERGGVDSSISITLGDGVEHRTAFRTGSGLSVSQLPEQTGPQLFPIFAYGCRRGSALGGRSRQVNLEDDSGPEVATLFDEGADLIQAETWLISLEGDINKNPRSKLVYDALISALKALLNVSEIYVGEQRLWAVEASGVRVPFSSLSDGYLTQAGWFLDLVARWLRLAEQDGIDVDLDFLSRMRGLVLIDEIDLHLHPQWQTEIIARTRKLLPQMSFVVTTHNPLTLVGARAEEIFVLSRVNGQLEAIAGASNPMLLSGGQLYKQYFGITDIFPSEIGRQLQRFGYLSGNPLRTDDEQLELEQIQQVLSDSGINPGWDVTPRTQAPDLKLIRRPRPRKAAKERG